MYYTEYMHYVFYLFWTVYMGKQSLQNFWRGKLNGSYMRGPVSTLFHYSSVHLVDHQL
jgi:hypothetical protein